MAIVFVIVLAVAAFFFWSVNGAKKQGGKFLTAVIRSIEDQVRNTPRLPSWHKDERMRDHLAKSLAPFPSQSSPFDPEVVKEWLDASLTQDDILTFMHHAERVGFSPMDQIALAPDAAKAFLAQDLVKAPTIVDKMIMLRLIAVAKDHPEQRFLDLNEFAYPVVHRFLTDFGGTDDGEEDWEAMYLSCDFPFRDGYFPITLEISADPKLVPTVHLYDIKPTRGWATE